MGKEKSGVSPLMREVSGYIADGIKRPLPKEVVERAKLHLVDTLAAMISGSTLLPGRRVISYVKSLGGNKDACVVGTRILTSATNAAFANGLFGHADETDDTHPPSMTHPGTSVIAAAMAIAERKRHGGVAFIRAMVIGYEICGRLMMSLHPWNFSLAGHHAGSFGQLFGASAAAGALCGLNKDQVRHMLAYTGQQAAGLSNVFRDPEHNEKAFNMGGMPAQNGVAAALMVEHGFTGVADTFSGERNFFHTFCKGGDPEELGRELGKSFELVKNCSIKKWPVGAPILGPLDAVENLLREHKIAADDIEKVVVRIGEKEKMIIDNRDMPDISLQHLVAVMLLDGTVTFKSSHDFKRMRDPKVLKLRQRIELIGAPELTDANRRWLGEVTVQMRDGRQLKHHTHAARGSAFNPMTRDEEDRKCLDLMMPVLGKQRSLKLIDALWNIDKVKDMRDLRQLCMA